MAADINDEIYNRIDTFMRVPYHMNLYPASKLSKKPTSLAGQHFDK